LAVELRDLIALAYQGDDRLLLEKGIAFLPIFSSWVLQNVINEVPVGLVERKFGPDRGTTQS
jgi:hypothetical protein